MSFRHMMIRHSRFAIRAISPHADLPYDDRGAYHYGLTPAGLGSGLSSKKVRLGLTKQTNQVR